MSEWVDDSCPEGPFEPSLPYAGTQGWSGSDTSRERAERHVEEGIASKRQRAVLEVLVRRGGYGLTVKELRESRAGWHHGVASGILSVLHMDGRIARLKERRDRCAIYVLPDHVEGRLTAPHARNMDTYNRAFRDGALAVADLIESRLIRDPAGHIPSVVSWPHIIREWAEEQSHD